VVFLAVPDDLDESVPELHGELVVSRVPLADDTSIIKSRPNPSSAVDDPRVPAPIATAASTML
jgi:hypothetical protein